MGPEKAGLQPDGFLEQVGALRQAVLLNPNRPQHRTGRGARLGIGERQLGLLVGFLEPSFLDEDGRPLEGLVRLRTQGADRRQGTTQQHSTGEGSERPLPPRRPGGPLGGADIVLYGPHSDTTTTISSRTASRTEPIVPGCTAC